MKLGLFLTPGAARTAYQVGAVYALMSEHALRFDVIAASSVGALNGVFAAMGEIDELARTWAGWKSRDVLDVDFQALLEGAVLWSPNLMKYDAYRSVITEQRVRPDKLLAGTRFRFNLANLTTGEQRFLEWPGEAIPLVEAVRASVAVPALIEPREIDGMQWADGLTVDGFPLEPLLLEAGIDRAFVVGVAPRQTDARLRSNLLTVLLRSIDWNQESETTLGLERAELINDRIRTFRDDRRAVERALDELVEDTALRAELLAEVERCYEQAGFPHARDVVDIVTILPAHDIEVMYADYDPRRTLSLIEQGRHDALATLARLEQAAA